MGIARPDTLQICKAVRSNAGPADSRCPRARNARPYALPVSAYKVLGGRGKPLHYKETKMLASPAARERPHEGSELSCRSGSSRFESVRKDSKENPCKRVFFGTPLDTFAVQRKYPVGDMTIQKSLPWLSSAPVARRNAADSVPYRIFSVLCIKTGKRRRQASALQNTNSIMWRI